VLRVSIEGCRLDTVSSMEVIKDMNNDHQYGCLCKGFVYWVVSSMNHFTIRVSAF